MPFLRGGVWDQFIMLFLMSVLGMVAVGASVMMQDEGLEEAASGLDGDGETEADQTSPGENLSATLPAAMETESAGSSPISLEGDMRSLDTSPGVTQTGNQDADPSDPHWGIQDGTALADTISGSEDNEFLLGREGADSILGNGGTDQIEGGAGDDTLSGGADHDSLDGDAGNDSLSGDGGDDTLNGHSGDDTLEGGAGHDSLNGGQDDDLVSGGGGNDAVHGYHGDDTLYGGAGEDVLFGSLGNDMLYGSSVDGMDDGVRDYLNGGAGDDVIAAGAGDVVTGGEGADTIGFTDDVSGEDAIQVMDFEQGTDSLVVMYEGDQAPVIEVAQDAQNTDLYRILADDTVIAEVFSATGLSAGDVLLAASTAT